MATILLENVPDAVHRALKARAEVNSRSLNAEVIACLEIVLGQEGATGRQIGYGAITLSNDSLWDACHSVQT